MQGRGVVVEAAGCAESPAAVKSLAVYQQMAAGRGRCPRGSVQHSEPVARRVETEVGSSVKQRRDSTDFSLEHHDHTSLPHHLFFQTLSNQCLYSAPRSHRPQPGPASVAGRVYLG